MPLQHLHLHVRSRPVAEKFYADWFGLSTKRRGSEITFMNDDKRFLLALAEDASAAPLPAWFHFGFEFDAREAVLDLYNRFRQANVPIRKEIYQDEGFASFRCSDPDGYVIEVYWDAGTT
jgi:catechol-2,3-dioxygenase